MTINWKYVGIIGVVLVLAFIGWTIFSINSMQADYEAVADCLSEKGIIMAGTDTCPACKNQKALFGTHFDKINYKNCDLEKDWCEANGITGYPTWVFPNGTQALGVKDSSFLSEAAGCTEQ